MHYSTILLGAIASPLVLGKPVSIVSRQTTSSIPDNTVDIKLFFGEPVASNVNQDALTLGPHDSVFAGNNLRDKVLINFGAGIDPNLRCKAIAIGGEEIVVRRGANIDDTFAPGEAGAWTFVRPQAAQVSEIICDSSFTKADPADSDITLTLINSQTSEQVVFRDVVEFPSALISPVSFPDSWSTLTLKVGRLVDKQDVRCQVKDPSGNPIRVNRGQNLNRSTFSDGGQAAPWTFADPILSPVSQWVCDASFIPTQ